MKCSSVQCKESHLMQILSTVNKVIYTTSRTVTKYNFLGLPKLSVHQFMQQHKILLNTLPWCNPLYSTLVAPLRHIILIPSQNQSLLLLLNADCFAEKQQIPISQSLVLPHQTSNPRSTALQVSTLIITPLMQFIETMKNIILRYNFSINFNQYYRSSSSSNFFCSSSICFILS